MYTQINICIYIYIYLYELPCPVWIATARIASNGLRRPGSRQISFMSAVPVLKRIQGTGHSCPVGALHKPRIWDVRALTRSDL